MEEFDSELKQEYIGIIKRMLTGGYLDSRETNMAFYWKAHQAEPCFEFIKEALDLDDEYQLKPKKKKKGYWFWRRKKKHDGLVQKA